MAQVNIKVIVDRTQFDVLRTDVNALNNKTINLNTKSAVQGAQQLTNVINQTNQTLNATQNNINQTFNQRFITNINKSTNSVQQYNQAQEKSNDLLNNFRQYITTRLFNAVGMAFKSALEELKAIDTEMVTIQKVTKMTADEMEVLGQKANDVAQALGATASQFLEAVSAFSKAGYAEQADELGELAIKTARAGNTTQEIANQFLLSVDKAYDFKGSIEELTTVLDGANEIGNKFATDVEHIAQGLGKVSPIAAQAHVGIDELTAAIGTITAVTQRSGNEAATALRALMLNIIGDTKTEIEDGVTWTIEEIENLQDVIKKYASEAYNAAQASGEVINPMEAIAGLAQSFKDGFLTEQELMGMVSDIGGKLRSSQLLALIQNFDMYQDMMATYAESAGSVEAEYEIYLNSWEAKTNQLKATWTEFVDNLVNTETIKGAITALTGLIETLDSRIGRLALVATAVGVAFKLFSGTNAVYLITSIKSVGDAVAALQLGFEALTTAMLTNPLFWVAAGFAAIFAFTKAMDALGLTIKGMRQRVEELTEKVTDLKTEYDKLAEKDNRTAEEEWRIKYLEKEIELQEELLRIEAQRLYNEENGYKQTIVTPSGEEYSVGASAVGSDTRGQATSRQLGTQFAEITDQEVKVEELIDSLSDLDVTSQEYADTLDTIVKLEERITKGKAELNQKILEEYKYYEDLLEKGVQLEDTDKQAYEQLKALLGVYDELPDSVNAYKRQVEALEGAVKQETVAEVDRLAGYEKLKEKLNVVTTAQKEMASSGELNYDTVVSLVDKFPELQDQLMWTGEAYELTDEALQILIIDMLREFNLGNSASAVASAIIAAEGDKQKAYKLTTQAILESVQAQLLQNEIAGVTGMDGATERANNPAYNKYVQNTETLLTNARNAVDVIMGGLTPPPVTTGGGGGGNGGDKNQKEVDEYLESLKKEISAEETKLTLMEKQGKSTEELNEKRRKIQELLHKEAEHLKKTGASQEEIDKLSIEWWNIQKDINDALEEAKKKLEEIAEDLRDELEDAVDKLLDDAKKARDLALDQLDQELEAVRARNEANEKGNELAEKQNAILEARIALQNAINERTVRYFNASTGQWEWGANAANVDSARQNLKSAEDDLREYQKQRQEEALEAEIERRKQAINDTYDAIEEEWNKLLESMEEPTRDITAILQDIAKNGTPLMQAQVANIGMLLGNLAGYLASFTGETPAQLQGLAKSKNTGSVDYSKKMMNAQSEDEFLHYAGLRTEKIAKEGIDIKAQGYKSNEQLYNEWKASHSFDSGGILRGIGGIKATSFNEMILPPDITKAMLSPSMDGIANQRMDELRYLYGIGGNRLGAGTIDNRIGSQYNGDIYNMNGYTLTEGQARTTTVYDFVKLSRSLSIYNNNVN